MEARFEWKELENEKWWEEVFCPLISKYNIEEYTLEEDELEDLCFFLNGIDKFDGVWTGGCYKIVFIPNDESCNKVFKVSFVGAPREPELFDLAREKGLENYFAESGPRHYVHSSKSCNSFYWYTQEKVEDDALGTHFKDTMYDWKTDSYRCGSRKGVSGTYMVEEDSNLEFYSAASSYALSDFGKLLLFLARNSINDLHRGNFALRKGAVKICDYDGG